MPWTLTRKMVWFQLWSTENIQGLFVSTPPMESLFPSLTNASSSAGSTPGEVAGRNNCSGTGTKFRNGNRLNSHNARLGSIHLWPCSLGIFYARQVGMARWSQDGSQKKSTVSDNSVFRSWLWLVKPPVSNWIQLVYLWFGYIKAHC